MRECCQFKKKLYVFEHLNGLKIIFHKSGIFLLGKAKDKALEYKTIFTCVEGDLPLKYLEFLFMRIFLEIVIGNLPRKK